MRTTIDSGGRVVIPKALRDRIGLVAGAALEVRERDGRIEIEIETAPTPMRVAKSGRGPAAVPEIELPPLTDDIVRTTLERVRR